MSNAKGGEVKENNVKKKRENQKGKHKKELHWEVFFLEF